MPATADPDQVAEDLDFLTTADEEAFALELVAYVQDRTPELTIAFRSPQLVKRTAKTADRLLTNHGPLVVQGKQESRNAYAKRASRARAALAVELRLARDILRGDAARLGRIDHAPNPRARARERLAAEQPVRFLELLREEQAKAKRTGRR